MANYYWVIDKDTLVKVPSTTVHSVNSLVDSTNQSDIASHWLPSAAALTIMDPNEPKPLMKLSMSTEYDSLRYDTNVLIDSAANYKLCKSGIFISKWFCGKMCSWTKNRCSHWK